MADYELPENRYTNKDFQAIYEEMLEYARKLSLKWDPSQSNESDPGVVLIKELALFADKNNYNADKNLLEAFPSTVSQIGNARKLFEQLGYSMKWYRSGTSEITMRWIGESDDVDNYIPIPKFTMVTDDATNNVYTIVDNKSLNTRENTVFNVIEGIATDYTVAGSKRITAEHLDANNRLYFIENNVAENGIFICNVDDYDEPMLNYDEWNKVDNLSVEPYMYGETYNRIYKFGVLSDGNTCYIEFPDNAASIINYGINITYILSNGENGNIKANSLSKFYNDVIISGADGSDTVLSKDNVMISNFSSIDNGYQPESIDDAYRNYKKTIGTFNTLVSLRDYMNAINTSGLISNGFVTDRTNDIQSSYHVVSTLGGTKTRLLKIISTESNTSVIDPEMNAFDLKMYLLDLVDKDSISTITDYDGTFNMVMDVEGVGRSESVFDVLNYIDDNKSIQHDFQSQKPDRVCMIINKYPIKCTIIPKHRITRVQEEEIKGDIVSHLCDNLNSQKIEFGESIDYDFVYNIIVDSNELIKNIILDDITYQAYAIYWDNKATDKNGNPKQSYVEKLISGDMSDNQYYGTYGNGAWITSSKLIDTGWEFGDRCLDINTGDVYYYVDNGNQSGEWKLDKITTIQDDIYSKSVLNGNTQLFVQDEDFDYTYTQNPVIVDEQTSSPVVENVSVIGTQSDIVINISDGHGKYELQPNENIILQSPSLITKESYTVGVRFQYQINDNIQANASYKLKQNESVCFYWTEEDTDSADYRYAYYGEGTIISPTFDMMKSNSATGSNDLYTVTAVPYVPSIMGITSNSSTYVTGGKIVDSYNGDIYTCKEFIRNKLSSSVNNLSSTKYIEIKETNQKEFSFEIDKYRRECYWILNKKTKNDSTGKYEYVLFDSIDDEEWDGESGNQSYTLNANEYFMYTNEDHSEFEILGPGTEIIRSSNKLDSLRSPWACEVIDNSYQKILTDGVKSLSNYWQAIPSDITITAVENTIYTVGEGATIHFSAYEWVPQNLIWENTESGDSIVTADDFIIEGHMGASPEEESGYFYTNGAKVELYDLNHVYFDTNTGTCYYAKASSKGGLYGFVNVMNSYLQITVIKDNEKIPYCTYITQDEAKSVEVYDEGKFSKFTSPRSDNYQCSVILVTGESSEYSIDILYKGKPKIEPYTVGDGASGTITEKTLEKYINLTDTIIDEDAGTKIQNGTDEQVKSYLTSQMPANSISSNIYYYVPSEDVNKKCVRVWSVSLCSKLNNVSILFHNDGCSIQSDDSNFDSLSEFAMWYEYGSEVVKIPPVLLDNITWKGHSVLNLDMSNSSAQDLLNGQSINATTVDTSTENSTRDVKISSKYVWSNMSSDVSEIYAFIGNGTTLSESSGEITSVTGSTIYWTTSVTGSTIYWTTDEITPSKLDEVEAGVGNYYIQVLPNVETISIIKGYKSIISDTVSVLSNKELLVDGPKATVSETDLFGNVTYVKLFNYNYVENYSIDEGSNVDVSYQSDGSIFINLNNAKSEGNTVTVYFNVYNGSYIIPIDTNVVGKGSDAGTVKCYFEVSVNGEWEKFDAYDMTYDSYASSNYEIVFGKHFYQIQTEEKKSLRLKIEYTPFNAYDVDGDGKITVDDALKLLRAVSGQESSEGLIPAHDIDGDGNITVADALSVLRVAARIASVPVTDNSMFVKIDNIYKYTNPQLPMTYDSILKKEEEASNKGVAVDLKMSDNTLNTLVRNIVRLNGVNGDFDFTYQVTHDEEIVNPIDANSFFNKHHIYNNFTIGKMKTLDDSGEKSLIDIKVTQVLR